MQDDDDIDDILDELDEDLDEDEARAEAARRDVAERWFQNHASVIRLAGSDGCGRLIPLQLLKDAVYSLAGPISRAVGVIVVFRRGCTAELKYAVEHLQQLGYRNLTRMTCQAATRRGLSDKLLPIPNAKGLSA